MKVLILNQSNRHYGKVGEWIGREPWYAENTPSDLMIVKVGKQITYLRENEIRPIKRQDS